MYITSINLGGTWVHFTIFQNDFSNTNCLLERQEMTQLGLGFISCIYDEKKQQGTEENLFFVFVSKYKAIVLTLIDRKGMIISKTNRGQ